MSHYQNGSYAKEPRFEICEALIYLVLSAISIVFYIVYLLYYYELQWNTM